MGLNLLKEKLFPTKEKQDVSLISIDPSEVIKNNPAGLVVSPDIYRRIVDNFSPELLDPIQIVQVQIYSQKKGTIIKPLAVDGLHRSKVLSDHKGQPLPDKSGFYPKKISAKDVTAAYLEMPWVVPDEERVSNQQALTMIQYLRVVIPWTKEHSQIAPDRIAAQLINGWNSIVGEALAERFSALAALNFLNNPNVPTANTEELKDYLSKQKELLLGLHPNERIILESALTQTSHLIKEAELIEADIAKAAFALIGGKIEAIGGENQARKEVYGLLYGLLYTPKIEEVLRIFGFDSLVELESRRTQLGEVLYQALCQSETVDIDTLIAASSNPYLSIEDIKAVLTAVNPKSVLTEVKTRTNTDLLTQSYLASTSRNNLTEIESKLVSNLSHDFDIEKLNDYAETIDTTTKTLLESRLIVAFIEERFKNEAVNKAWKLLQLKLINLERPILNSKNLDNVRQYTQTLTNHIHSTKEKINTTQAQQLSLKKTPTPLRHIKQPVKKIPESPSGTSSKVQTEHGVVPIIKHKRKNENLNNQLIEVLASINFQLTNQEFKLEDLGPETIAWMDKILDQLCQLRFDIPSITAIIKQQLKNQNK